MSYAVSLCYNQYAMILSVPVLQRSLKTSRIFSSKSCQVSFYWKIYLLSPGKYSLKENSHIILKQHLPGSPASLRISFTYPRGTFFSDRFSIWWRGAGLKNDNNLISTLNSREYAGVLCYLFICIITRNQSLFRKILIDNPVFAHI